MNTPLMYSDIAHILEGFHSYTCAPNINPLMECAITAFSFPAEAGPHLLTPEGWNAELVLVITCRSKNMWFSLHLFQKLSQ